MLYEVITYSIAVSIIGGLGSWSGAILASFLIGFAQILTEAFLSAHYQMVVALLAIILTLIRITSYNVCYTKLLRVRSVEALS